MKLPTINLANLSDCKLNLVIYPSGAYLEMTDARDGDRVIYSKRVDEISKRAEQMMRDEEGDDYGH